MKNTKKESEPVSRPQKVLLHMAKIGDDWAGNATDFKTEEKYKFKNLKELFSWLRGK
jgi:hypothetical protein